MTVLRYELRRGWKAAVIWAVALSAFTVAALLLYPRVSHYSDMFNRMISQLGILSQIFSLSDMDVFEFMNYYGLEVGNFVGLGGGMFAAITGIGIVAREEGRHTAEFLFPHPVGRLSVLVQKFVAMALQVVLLNLVCVLGSRLGAGLIGASFPEKVFRDFHVSLLLMNLQVAVLCFGLSCMKKRDSAVPGLGIVLVFYFLNLFINVNREAASLKYFTPYYYTDIARMTNAGAPLWTAIGVGFAAAGVVLVIGAVRFIRKDLAI